MSKELPLRARSNTLKLILIIWPKLRYSLCDDKHNESPHVWEARTSKCLTIFVLKNDWNSIVY